MSELKPCPFCVSEAGLPTNLDGTPVDYEVTDCTCKNDDCPISEYWIPIKIWQSRPIEDALHASIAELEAERRWRVVADGEFPELGEEVIFYDSIMERRLKGCLRKNCGVEWLSDEGYTFSSRDGRYSRITHWMPLPEPPEVQE